MAEQFERKVINLDKGVWNKENARDVPEGALRHARNCEYRGLTKGLSRRRGQAWGSAAISGQAETAMIAHFRRFADSTDKIVLLLLNSSGTQYTTYTATTSGISSMTFASLEVYDTSVAFVRPTSITYNDVFYWCGSGLTPRAWNGTTVRAAGITNPSPAIVPSVFAVSGTGITVSEAYHFTYRYKNSTDNVVGELINGNNLILSTSYPAASGATLQGWEITNLPTSSPATGVDQIQVFMSLDEDIPSAFYLMETLTIGAGPLFRPSAVTTSGGVGAGTITARSTSAAFDGDPQTKATFIQDTRTGTATTGEYRYITFQVSTRADWRIEVDYTYSAGTANNTTIDYSTNAGGAWTNMVTLTTTSAGFTTVVASPVGSISSANIMVRIVMPTIGAGTGGSTELNIYDIRLMTTAASGRLTINRTPSRDEEFVNSGNFGHYQPPPDRIFPYTFEGHILGVSGTDGLWLAYSETDKAENWSTDPGLAAFPFLIPFKDKEVDSVVGAAPIRNQLIVFCTDSVWRINHLPVLSDPEADASTLFAETRAIAKQRITDSIGCVHEKAYTVFQMGNDQDVVFFWSRSGPAVTDGNKVWKVSDHYDWTSISDIPASVIDVFNDPQNSTIYVVFEDRTNLDRFALTFYYSAAHVMEVTPDAIRMKVLGPLYAAHGIGWGLMLYVGSTAWVPGGAAAARYVFMSQLTGTSVRVVRIDEGTTDADTSTPVFQWSTREYGEFGQETYFDHAVISAQETGSEALPFSFIGATVTPQVPVDKDPLQINGQGHSLVMTYGDGGTADLTAFDIRGEDGALVQYPSTGETVTYTATTRTINSVTLYHRPSRPVAD